VVDNFISAVDKFEAVRDNLYAAVSNFTIAVGNFAAAVPVGHFAKKLQNFTTNYGRQLIIFTNNIFAASQPTLGNSR
jgi:hypothetical protein